VRVLDGLAVCIETLRVERRKKWVIALIAYGDDSADETKSRVFAAATVVARQEEWDAFNIRWLDRNGDRPFHATDCDSDEGDFKHTDHKSNKKLYGDNVHLFINSPLMGAGVSISIRDYEELFPFSPSNEWPYYMCFSGAIACIAKIGQLSIPPERVKVTFDRNINRDYNADALYNFMVHQQSWDSSAILEDTIEFANHRQSIGVQVADLLARESMKDLDNRLAPVRRGRRQSLRELLNSNRFACICYDRPKLEAHRIGADQLHGDIERGKAYRQWLNDKRLADSIQSRLRFMNKHDTKLEK